LQDNLIWYLVVEEGQVLAHAGLEQLHILGHHADLLAQLGSRCLGNIEFTRASIIRIDPTP